MLEEYQPCMTEIALIRKSLAECIINSKVDPRTGFLGVANLFVSAAISLDIPKPHLLSMVSQLWEFMDKEKEEGRV